jgi:hypothetical protein
MRTKAMLCAGAVLSLAAFANSTDSFTEERYRAKYGRYTPAAEARQKLVAKPEAPACCRSVSASFKNAPRWQASAEAVFRTKHGRNTPAGEAREKLAATERRMHLLSCAELGKCTFMQPDKPPVLTSSAAAVDSWREEFFRAKYGRAFQVNTEAELSLSAAKVTCEHDCCKRSD